MFCTGICCFMLYLPRISALQGDAENVIHIFLFSSGVAQDWQKNVLRLAKQRGDGSAASPSRPPPIQSSSCPTLVHTKSRYAHISHTGNHMHTQVYRPIHVHARMHKLTSSLERINARTTPTHAHTQKCKHMHRHTHINTSICICAHAHTNTQTCTCVQALG
jgi:hypothetical protein